MTKPRIHAHRGASAVCPENTLAAFRLAIDEHADAIEFDVHVTSDGHPVVVHDFDLARTTSGSGLVHERDLAYLRGLSAGRWFSETFEGEQVPLLDEVLALDGIDFELELKGLPTKALVDAVISSVRNADVVQRVEFTGFYLLAIAEIQRQLPDARYGFFPPMFQSWMTDHLYEQLATEGAVLGAFDLVHVPLDHLQRVDAVHVHDRGLGLHQGGDADTIDALITTIAAGVDQLSTSHPELAITMREA